MKTNFLKLLLPLTTLLVTANIYSQWSVNAYADESTPTPYCEIVTVTFTITNNNSPGNMSGLIEYNPNWFDIVDASDLPSYYIDDTDPYEHLLYFDAGVIGGSTTSKQFE